MKRNVVLALLVIAIVTLALLALPAKLANHSQAKTPKQTGRSLRDGLRHPEPDLKKLERSLLKSRVLAAAVPQTPEFVSRQAEGFGVTPAVRDLPRAHATLISEKMKDPRRDGREDEEKVENDEVKQSIGLETDFRLASLLKAGTPTLPSAMPTPILDFNGNTHTVTNFLPPDTNGDVGPNHFVQATNANNAGQTTIGVYNKTTGVPIVQFSLAGLFAGLPGTTDLCETHDDGDPIALYDPLADRWLVSQFAIDQGAAPSRQCIAISQTADPTLGYFLYSFAMPDNGTVNDYPHFGVWPNAYYMSDNQFNDALTAFLGAGCFAFNRAKMLAGDPTANYIYFNVATIDPGAGGLLPTDFDGLVAPPPALPQLFMEFRATEFSDPADTLRLYEFVPNFVTPASSTFTVRPDIPLTAFDANSPAGRLDIEQPAPGAGLDAISDRLMWRLSYRNLGGTNSWVGNFTVNVSGTAVTGASTYQAGIKWFEVHSAGTTVPAAAFDQGIHSSGPISGATGLNNWMGSIAQDNAGNLALGYSQSSTTQNADIKIAGRTAGSGTLNEGEALFEAAGGVQTSTSSRWGDYSSMSVDPADECTFWYTQEYYSATSSAIWNTRIGKFIFPGCTAPAKGTLVVNVTNCDSGLPVQGALITINNNLYGATGATGASSSSLAPATYTVTISATNYLPTTVNNVVISNGVPTILNPCLVGLPSIATASSTITAESCAPADNALSPNETVTINFGLKNGGTASTTNLVVTLQATGGVTSPSGPQNYGSIPPDNTTVVNRPFTFTVGAGVNCGDTVTATFALQDGATNLGTVTFTFNVGALAVPITASYSSGNIAVAIPDNTTVEIPITVPDNGVVADINVRVRLNHTFDDDLVISLVHPDGTVIALANNRGGSGDNFGTGANDCSGTPTVLDDEAVATIASGVAPFAGSFRPDNPLSGMDGKLTPGTWKLRIADTGTQDTGTVGCVTLEINRLRFVCCGVGGTPVIQPGSAPAAISLENCGGAGNGAIDPGETVTVDFPLVNNGTQDTTNLTATLQTTGGVVGVFTTNPQNYGVLLAGGAAVTRSFRFRASPGAACGSTLTATLQLQDGATNLGTVNFTFTLGALVSSSASIENSAPITIVDTAAANPEAAVPYPSIIFVGGLTNPVTKVTVTITNLSHTFPDNIDMLLVGPGGQKILLMSDAGGGTDVVNATYTFDDTAASTLADGALNASGTYKPTNFGTGDTFLAPAPAGPYPDPQLLSVFNGISPNGNWSLFIVDAFDFDSGSIVRWSLTITTSQRVCCSPTAAPAGISGRITAPDGSPVGGAVVRVSGGTSRVAVTDANGSYRIEELETGNFYSVSPSLANNSFSPSSRSFTLTGNVTDAGFTGNPDAAPSANAIDTTEYFVRQHYLDFLGREPDQGGLEFWSAQINQCGGDANCIRNKRIDVSAAFFASAEFQQTGSYIYGLYAGTLGRTLNYDEFSADRHASVGRGRPGAGEAGVCGSLRTTQ